MWIRGIAYHSPPWNLKSRQADGIAMGASVGDNDPWNHHPSIYTTSERVRPRECVFGIIITIITIIISSRIVCWGLTSFSERSSSWANTIAFDFMNQRIPSLS